MSKKSSKSDADLLRKILKDLIEMGNLRREETGYPLRGGLLLKYRPPDVTKVRNTGDVDNEARSWAVAIFQDGQSAGTVARSSGLPLSVFRARLGAYLKANPGIAKGAV